MELNSILSKDWQFFVGRPNTLFGASLYQRWFDPPLILELFNISIPNNLYIEEHPNVIRRYVIKDELKAFNKAFEQIVKTDKCKEMLEKGLALNKKAKEYLQNNPFKDLKSAVDFFVQVTLHSALFPYFSLPMITDKKLIDIAKELRGISYYPRIVKEIINPMAEKIVKDYNYLTLSEILNNNFEKAKERKTGKRFIYSKVDGKEYVYYVDDPINIIKKLEKIEIGNKATGQCAYPGKVIGKVKLVLGNNDVNFQEGDILVVVTSNPTIMPLIHKSAAIVCDEGGITCHASIVSRELKKPCVVGTKIGSHIFKNNDLIEVDATNGKVKLIERK